MDDFGREVGRKAVHLFALSYLVIYFLFDALPGWNLGLLALVGMLVGGIVIEYLRLERHARLPIISWLWRNFRRKKELNSPGAEIYFLLGIIVALSAFETRVAVAAILMTVFGDMTAALVGIRWGRIRPAPFRGKSLEGSLAAMTVNLIVGLIFLRDSARGSAWWLDLIREGAAGGPGAALWPVILVMAFTAALTELMISEIDDNLTIPVLSGFAGQLTFLITTGG